MFNVAYKQIKNRLVGCIESSQEQNNVVSVPISSEGWLENAGGTFVDMECQFFDMIKMDAAVDTLIDSAKISDICPYENFIRTPPVVGSDQFDWSTVPQSTLDTIMPHQIEAVNSAVCVHNGRSLVALKPGLGKTMIGSLFALHYGKPTLIVCPLSKISDWKQEYSTWTGSTLDDVVVVSFETLKVRPLYLHAQWGCVVVDESHYLKGVSDRSEEIIPMLQTAPAVILLTGTPQRNRPCELFNTLAILDSRTFSDREMFMRRYADGKIGPRGVWEERGSKYPTELALLINRFMYRNSDVTVVDLPIIRIKKYVAPTEKQLIELNLMEERRIALARAEMHAHTPQQKFRIGVARNTHANLMWRTAGKYKSRAIQPSIRDLIERVHPTEKIVFFCYHLNVAQRVATFLEQFGETVTVTGSTPLAKRQAALDDLKNPNGNAKFGVLSIKAIGEGVNLAPGVTVVVFVELDRVPASMEQAEKRVHRKGTTNPVHTYWFMLENSSDDRTLAMLEQKADVNGCIFGEDHTFYFDRVEIPTRA